MKERPIMFSSEMVLALLEDRKTMTRRLVKPQPSEDWQPYSYSDVHKMRDGEFVMRHGMPVVIGWGPSNEDGSEAHPCPYGQPGDRLWVKEHWEVDHSECDITYADGETKRYLDQSDWFKADWLKGSERRTRLRSSRFMPRWASRILLEVTSVRVERLQDISGYDAWAEGVPCTGWDESDWDDDGYPTPIFNREERAREEFEELWNSLYPKEPEKQWDANPFVWVVEFKKVAE